MPEYKIVATYTVKGDLKTVTSDPPQEIQKQVAQAQKLIDYKDTILLLLAILKETEAAPQHLRVTAANVLRNLSDGEAAH